MKLAPARPVTGRATLGPALRVLPRLLACAALGMALGAQAQSAPPPADEAASAPAPVVNSTMDAPMFYQLLVGEMEAQAGRPANAFEVILDAARRARDGALFQRAIEIAIQGRSGDRALAAAAAWRASIPESVDAVRTQVQLLVATERLDDLGPPLRTLIEQVPAAERSAVIAGVPRFLASAQDKGKALTVAQQALASFVSQEPTRTASRTTLGRLALAADQPDLALAQMQQAHRDDPGAAGPVLLALDLIAQRPTAEAAVRDYLARPDALTALRLAYVQSLDQRQRIGDAVTQLQLALAQQPETPQAWLTLGAYQIELQQPREAVGSLVRFVQMVTPAASAPAPADNAAEDDEGSDRTQRTLDYAYGLLAQAHEQLGDLKTASQWLDKIDASRVDLPVLARRASLMARQGKLKEARALVRTGAVRGTVEPRNRLLVEAQLLRDARQWQTAYDLLLGAMRETPDDSVVVYELAMTAERLARYDDMEALLKRVMQLKPDDAHAYNALGYSLAERNLRLPEAEQLLRRAQVLAPSDPFIIDSLGWIEFRLGRLDEALRLLQASHAARPHVEVAAHLGEVLWALGRRDEARQVWRDGRDRQADNEVLVETLRRLKVSL